MRALDFYQNMDFLISLGYIGLLLGSFLAGSVIPFSSELLLGGIITAGADPWISLTLVCVGNTLGGMTCYWLGRLGKLEWLIHMRIITQEKLERFLPKIDKYGAPLALLTFLPYMGEAIAIALGLLRTKSWPTAFYMFIGKGIRYTIILVSTLGIISLF